MNSNPCSELLGNEWRRGAENCPRSRYSDPRNAISPPRARPLKAEPRGYVHPQSPHMHQKTNQSRQRFADSTHQPQHRYQPRYPLHREHPEHVPQQRLYVDSGGTHQQHEDIGIQPDKKQKNEHYRDFSRPAHESTAGKDLYFAQLKFFKAIESVMDESDITDPILRLGDALHEFKPYFTRWIRSHPLQSQTSNTQNRKIDDTLMDFPCRPSASTSTTQHDVDPVRPRTDGEIEIMKAELAVLRQAMEERLEYVGNDRYNALVDEIKRCGDYAISIKNRWDRATDTGDRKQLEEEYNKKTDELIQLYAVLDTMK